MGIFSFLKNVGSGVFSRTPAPPAETPQEKKLRMVKALYNEIDELNFDVENISIGLQDDLETVIVQGIAKSQAEREKVILALGNVEGIASVDDRMEVRETVFYEVQSGDTLSKISQAHYGDPMKYNVIFEANKPMLKHPDKIYPGQKLRIPSID